MNTQQDSSPKRRSLILAGGGIKVAFQAGAMQVWLDEAELKFDHVDAASGGVFNLAMLCQGMTGTQIADNWRNIDPLASISFNRSRRFKCSAGSLCWEVDPIASRRRVISSFELSGARRSFMAELHRRAAGALGVWIVPSRLSPAGAKGICRRCNAARLKPGAALFNIEQHSCDVATSPGTPRCRCDFHPQTLPRSPNAKPRKA